MSYEKDQFGGGGGGGGEGSTSVSVMIATALGPYITSNSVSVAIANFITSNSASIMITSRISTYITSSSVATAIAPYLTSASFVTAISPYVTSNSVSIALATYLTSNSASIGYARLAGTNTFVASQAVVVTDNTNPGLSVVQAGTAHALKAAGSSGNAQFRAGTAANGYFEVTAYDTNPVYCVVSGANATQGVFGTQTNIPTVFFTNNTEQARIATDGTFTMLASLNVSATASVGALTIASKPVGCVLLGYQTLSNVNSWSFSGSWSDYAILQARALYRIETGTSATASAAIYTDGGTTAFLSLGTASTTQSANQIISVEYHVYGGDGRPIKLLEVNSRKQTNLQTFAVTATANTGFVNAIKYFSSATITAGMAVLYGFRKA